MNRHNWYYRFKADVGWLENFVGDVEETDRALVLALTDTLGVASGMVVTERGAGANFSVDISAGTAYNGAGQRIYSNATVNVPFVEDELGDPIEVTGGGNERIVSVYAQYALVDDPTSGVVDGFGDTVYTITKEQVAYRLYQGAIAPSGTATPAANPGGNLVLLANVTIQTGDTTIQNADIDESVKEYLSLALAPDVVGEDEIDWGLGANQVSAADVPIEDAGTYYTGTDVEAALQEIALGTGATTFKISRLAANSLTLAHSALTAARTVTYPDATGHVVILPTAATTETGSGAIVRTNSPTIVTPTIASFVNANHSHLNAAGGGTLTTSAIASGTFADGRIAASNVTQHQASLALAASQITSGTFADARIAASNVTQHQASLSIAETQIPDGTIFARVGSTEDITGVWRPPSADPPVAHQLTRQSLAKAWCRYDTASAILSQSYNMDSIGSDDGDGIYLPSFDIDVSNNVCVGNVVNQNTGLGDAWVVQFDDNTSSGGRFLSTYNITDAAYEDPAIGDNGDAFFLVVYGTN